MLQNPLVQLTKVYRLEHLVHIMQFPLMEIKLLLVLQAECSLLTSEDAANKVRKWSTQARKMHLGISMKNLATLYRMAM